MYKTKRDRKFVTRDERENVEGRKEKECGRKERHSFRRKCEETAAEEGKEEEKLTYHVQIADFTDAT